MSGNTKDLVKIVAKALSNEDGYVESAFTILTKGASENPDVTFCHSRTSRPAGRLLVSSASSAFNNSSRTRRNDAIFVS